MNPSHESRPGLLCRAVRGWSMLAGDPAAGAVTRHRAACPACQNYFAASAALDARLRAAAPRQAQALPPGFELRMERALAPLTREPAAAEQDSGSRWVLWSFFGSLATAAVVAFMFLRPAELPPRGSTIVATESSENLAPEISPATTGALLQLAQANPLERELDHVYADARGALRFLALNFLPASATEETPSS